MGEQRELRLVIEPGVIRTAGQRTARTAVAQEPKAGQAGAAVREQAQEEEVLSLQVPQWSAEQKEEVLNLLAAQPGELWDLLQGRLTGAAARLQLLPVDAGQAAGQGAEAEQRKQLLGLARQRLHEEPLLGFALRGLGRQELLSGVFALWADEDYAAQHVSNVPPSGMLSAELARLERKGPAVTTGEWLAEAAAEGSLHQPGPMFLELASRPFPAAPAVAPPAEDWGGLLPNTPRFSEGLALIMRKAAESAVRRAAGLGKL